MEIKIKNLKKEQVRSIFDWNYQGEYKVYNMPSMDLAIRNNIGIVNDDKRDKEFFSLYENNDFIGYIRLIDLEDIISFGIGLKPNYCGKGYSNKVMPKILEYIKDNYNGKEIRLIVRSFNKRAIKVYDKYGFEEIGTEYINNIEFIVMNKIIE
ncbi:GNAT family N-acetyltransferase [Peptostreptococcaceae bacterium AGR-M142]